MNFICHACKNKSHDTCAGDTWCDCQHRSSDVPRLPSR
jgi:hypothetical protein